MGRMFAVVKFQGIDGALPKQWSMFLV